MINRALQKILEQLLSLNTGLWIQIGGMAVSFSLGVLLFTFSSTQPNNSIVLLLLIEFLIIILSISTFSIYLTKGASNVAEKVSLRKTLGATGWSLFLETSIQTILIVLLSILFSVGLIDVSMPFAGLSFESNLNNTGMFQYSLLLFIVFMLSIAILFIIQGIALAPNIKSDINATTFFERAWFNKLTKILKWVSFILGISTGVLLFYLLIFLETDLGLKILSLMFYAIMGLWWRYNNRRGTTT